MARSITLRNGARKKAPVTIRNYQAAINFLDNLSNYEKLTRVSYNAANFNLARMNRLLASIGNPHKELRSVHIAGTKGKGSTAMMLASMLSNCGLKIGLYTSPHLVDVRERIQIDGQMISETDTTRLVARLAPVVRQMAKDEPTFFEIMTAMAFLYFVEQGVNLGVIETGLGGRLDSTNVLKPEVCAITSISYDHVGQLGHSLPQIAEEKAAIFKPGVPVVSSPQAPEVREVLLRVAEKVKAPLRFTGRDIEFSYRFESSRASGPQTRVSLTTANSRFEHLPVPLPGDHQAINCGLALSLMTVLKDRGFPIDDQRAIEGLAKAHLPGRMEVIHNDPRIMVDGAHNAASVEALMRAIGQNISYDSMVVIFACRTDKDIPGMLDHIQLGADKVIFTTTGSPRSADPAELSAQYVERSGKMAQVAATLEDALDIAERAVTREDLVCITGSFYIVGRAKQLVAERYEREPQLRSA
ncbi:MAG: folylpolyglutamate synthase [Phycisphaerae bacterium]